MIKRMMYLLDYCYDKGFKLTYHYGGVKSKQVDVEETITVWIDAVPTFTFDPALYSHMTVTTDCSPAGIYTTTERKVKRVRPLS